MVCGEDLNPTASPDRLSLISPKSHRRTHPNGKGNKRTVQREGRVGHWGVVKLFRMASIDGDAEYAKTQRRGRREGQTGEVERGIKGHRRALKQGRGVEREKARKAAIVRLLLPSRVFLSFIASGQEPAGLRRRRDPTKCCSNFSGSAHLWAHPNRVSLRFRIPSLRSSASPRRCNRPVVLDLDGPLTEVLLRKPPHDGNDGPLGV